MRPGTDWRQDRAHHGRNQALVRAGRPAAEDANSRWGVTGGCEREGSAEAVVTMLETFAVRRPG